MRVLTLDEAAAFLQVHPSTIYRMLRDREIPAFRVASNWRFTAESLERWVIEQTDATSRARAKVL